MKKTVCVFRIFSLLYVVFFYIVPPANAFDQAQLDRLKHSRSCAKCDLSGANLSNADLKLAYLAGANLSDADLSGAKLQYANLRGATLTGANLENADLRGANLQRAAIAGANLAGANMKGATGIKK